MDDDLLSPADLAEHLGVSIRTIYNWRSSNTGPQGFRVGRHVRYRRSDVEAWIVDQHRQAAEDAQDRA